MVSDNAQSRRLIEDWLPINAIFALLRRVAFDAVAGAGYNYGPGVADRVILRVRTFCRMTAIC